MEHVRRVWQSGRPLSLGENCNSSGFMVSIARQKDEPWAKQTPPPESLSPSARLRRTAARQEGEREKKSLLAVRCSLSPNPSPRVERGNGNEVAACGGLSP